MKVLYFPSNITYEGVNIHAHLIPFLPVGISKCQTLEVGWSCVSFGIHSVQWKQQQFKAKVGHVVRVIRTYSLFNSVVILNSISTLQSI